MSPAVYHDESDIWIMVLDVKAHKYRRIILILLFLCLLVLNLSGFLCNLRLRLFHCCLSGLFHLHLDLDLCIFLDLPTVLCWVLFSQHVVIVDVHDEEKDSSKQNYWAAHKENVLVVIKDVQKKPCKEKSRGAKLYFRPK